MFEDKLNIVDCSHKENFHTELDLIFSLLKFNKENMVSELSKAAAAEMSQADSREQNQSFYLNIKNYFGRFAEDKYLPSQ